MFDDRRSTKAKYHAAERGVAIIVTLVILAMLTILLVAFVSQVSVEKQASSAFSQQMKARLAAQAAVDQAIFQISQGTSTNNYYTTFISNNVFASLTTTNPITYFINNGMTFPGISTNYGGSALLLDSNNFNAQGFLFPAGLAPNVSIPWAYLTNSFASSSTVSNKGLTRIAWWIDDESSKINVNYNGNTNGTAPLNSHVRTNVFDVTSIDIGGITNNPLINSAVIITNRYPPYETLPTLMEVGITYPNLQGMAPFATVRSADYEVQTNGNPRVNINNLVTNTAVSPNVWAAVTNIHNAITNAYPNYASKYASGYYSSGDKAVYQIAANIRDYIDPSIIPTDENPNDYSGTNAYFGRKRVPYLNEVAFKTLVNNYTLLPGLLAYTNILTVSNYYSVELMNLYNSPFTAATTLQFDYPAVGYSSVGLSSSLGSLPLAGRTNLGCTLTVPAFGSGSYGIAITNYFLGAGTVTNIYSVPPSPYIIIKALNATTTMVSTNLYSLNPGGQRLDYDLVPLVPPQSLGPPAGVAGTVAFAPSVLIVSGTVESSASAIDPRLNHLTNDWVWSATDTLGSTNLTWKPNILGDGNDIPSLVGEGGFPFTNTNMLTVGELGNIAAPGTAGTTAGNISSTASSPYFRTLKMYGDGYLSTPVASTDVPDWALLDLFTVTNASARIDGKININTQRDMLYNGNYGTLQGLLQGILIYPGGSLINSTVAQTMATNIMALIRYQHIGQLGGNALTLSSQSGQTTDQRKEAVIRALSNVITTRGNSFTIYGKGQSVSIIHGNTNVLGEAYIQSIVERIPQFNGSGAVTGQTFKVKYHRFLTE